MIEGKKIKEVGKQNQEGKTTGKEKKKKRREEKTTHLGNFLRSIAQFDRHC